jgi:hypothetical protein
MPMALWSPTFAAWVVVIFWVSDDGSVAVENEESLAG